MEKTPHIAILPSPGMGHLIPLAEFAKQLVQHHHISATIIIPTTEAPPKTQIDVLESLPDNIHHMFLPPVSLQGLSKDVPIEIKLFFIMKACLPGLRDALSSLVSRTHLVALVYDMFGGASMEVALEFNLPKFLFFPMAAMILAFSFYLPKLDEETSGEYRYLLDPIKIPGSVSVRGRDLMSVVRNRSDDAYKGCLQFCKELRLLDGILINTFEELEKGTLGVLRGNETGNPPIYAIGPIIQKGLSNGSGRHECLDWLDKQPTGSVLLVCFGSGGTLSLEQLNELAFGLDMSSQRFLWILKSPNERASSASFFTASSQTDPLSFLPEGFLARTEERGLVVPSWAPQVEILSHESTGAFLTHCGWNSILESVVNGIPMIAWPLYAEQHMNAVMLTEGLGLTLRAKTDENGIVRKEEVEKVVNELMEGEEGKMIRKKMRELKGAAMKALGDGGSSMESVSKFALQLKSPGV